MIPTSSTSNKAFAARHKKSGKLVYFKTRQGQQDAMRKGTHEDPGAKNDTGRKDDKTTGVPTKPDANKPNASNQTTPKTPEPVKPNPADFQSSAEKDKQSQTSAPQKLKDLIPGLDTSKKTLDQVDPLERQKIATIIDKLAELGKQAAERGEKAPNFNLCQVTIPGTNLYCDGNKGIGRLEMPQFKGVPNPESPAANLPKDKNGEVDTEKFFQKLMDLKGVKISQPIAVHPDKLKATQSELVGVKVAQMSKVLNDRNHPAYGAITAPIYVSNDGYVLDGHHRWAAIVAYNAGHPHEKIPMKIKVINEPIEPLVHQANEFAKRMGIQSKSANTPSTPINRFMKRNQNETISKLSSLIRPAFLSESKFANSINEASINIEQYAQDFQRYIEMKYRNKLVGGFKLEVDRMAGTFEWSNKVKNRASGAYVLATPFWDGEPKLPINVYDSNGKEFINSVQDFRPSGNMQRDEQRYLEILRIALRNARTH